MGAPGTDASAAGGRLRADQAQNLLYQGGDIVAQLGSGSGLGMIAMQQGPQIAQVFAGPGGASVKGAFAQAGEAAGGLAARVGVIGAAFGGLAAVALTGVGALVSFRNSQGELEKSVTGIGRASGVTVGQINALAPAAAAAGNVSTRSARQMAGEYAATGKIGSEMYAGLIGSAKDYAATTGQEIGDANTALAAAFSDPAKGADALNAQLGFLNDTTRESIQRLQAQGDRLGAQKLLFDAYKNGISSAAELTSGWSRITSASTAVISNAWDKVGQTIDRVATGGDLETRIATAQKVVDASRARAAGGFGAIFPSMAGSDVTKALDDLKRLQDAQKKLRDQSEEAKRARASIEVGELVRGYNPASEQLKKLQDDAKKIAAELKAGVLDPDGRSQRTIDGLIRAAAQLKSDMAAGGAAYADALKSAEREQALVGAAPFGRGVADINNDIEQKKLVALRASMEDNDQGAYQKRLDTLEKERVIRLDTARQTQALEQTQRGGAFARAPADIQKMILEASARFPAIPPEILAAVGEKENGFKLSGPTKVLNSAGLPSTTAYGYGQITDPAQTDIRNIPGMGGFDKKDPSTAVMGAAAYLDLRRKWVGGDMLKALDGYGTGPGYGVDVLRRAGKLGDVSNEGVAKEIDATAQANKNLVAQVQNVRENYGKNGVALEANARATEQYNSLLARGVPASDALALSIKNMATSAATAAQQMKMIQFAADVGFDREQLGRTSGDQQAYARARSTVGDTTSGAAQMIIEQTRLNDNLRETKSLATDAFSSMLTDLRQGTTLAKSLETITGRLADKLLSKAADSVMSNLFAGLGSSGMGNGGGGFGSMIASALGLSGGAGTDIAAASARGAANPALYGPGFASGGYTGSGGRNEVAGPVHRGEYVFDAAATARIGVASLEAMRTNRRGWEGGGYVGNAPTWMAPPANGPQQQAPANIVVYNNSGSQVEAKEVEDGRGGRRQEIVINEAVAKGIGSPVGQQALGQRRVAQR